MPKTSYDYAAANREGLGSKRKSPRARAAARDTMTITRDTTKIAQPTEQQLKDAARWNDAIKKHHEGERAKKKANRRDTA